MYMAYVTRLSINNTLFAFMLTIIADHQTGLLQFTVILKETKTNHKLIASLTLNVEKGDIKIVVELCNQANT